MQNIIPIPKPTTHPIPLHRTVRKAKKLEGKNKMRIVPETVEYVTSYCKSIFFCTRWKILVSQTITVDLLPDNCFKLV